MKFTLSESAIWSLSGLVEPCYIQYNISRTCIKEETCLAYQEYSLFKLYIYWETPFGSMGLKYETAKLA